jgi:hypothetical protein
MKPLTWRDGVVLRILFLIAKWFATDDELKKEIHSLSCHISVSDLSAKT